MKIRSTLAKAFSTTLVAAMLMAGIPEAAGIQTPFAVTAQAAKKKTVKKKKKVKKVKKKYKENPRLSKTRLSIRNKKTATVKVSGTKKGISVTSSDKSIATVSRSGKFAFRVRAAKKKKGAAVIRVKTSRGYKYLFVQVGGRTNMSGKTMAWAQAGGFIQVPQPSTPQAQKPETVPAAPAQPQQPVQPSNPQPQQPAVTQPQTQAQTQPGTQAQTSAPETQPQTTHETKAPETQPETRTPETQPQTQPQTTPETKAPETQPETTPETKQSETQKQTESEPAPVTRASLYDNSIEARKAYDLKVATQCGFFDNSVSYKQKLQNMMLWMENNVNYDLDHNVGCWQAFYQYADNTTYFSDLHKNWPDEYPEGVLCYDGAGYILNFACYFLNLKGTLFRADTPGIGWSGHIAAAIYLPAQGADPAGWYVVNPSYKNYGMRKMKVERITEQSNKTWYDDIIRSVTDYEPRTKQSIIRDDLMNYRP